MIIKGKDGETHINIYSKGETSIGRWLSNFAYSPINIPGDGVFKSIEGYWYWLLSGDDRLRDIIGFEAKSLGRSLVNYDSEKKDENFKEKIKFAIDLKLKSDKNKMKEFYESSLPFCHYYSYNNKKKDAGYEWIVEHIESRRVILKKHFNIEK